MKTLMIDMDNVITDGNVLQIISEEIGRDIKVGDTFYLQNLIENKEYYKKMTIFIFIQYFFSKINNKIKKQKIRKNY